MGRDPLLGRQIVYYCVLWVAYYQTLRTTGLDSRAWGLVKFSTLLNKGLKTTDFSLNFDFEFETFPDELREKSLISRFQKPAFKGQHNEPSFFNVILPKD